ncbi:MAG: hypothetical protein ACOYYS_15755 [Chloroflexota bacterium]
MQLPNLLTRPAFNLIYPLINLAKRGPFPPLVRRVQPVDGIRRKAFDGLLDEVIARGPSDFIAYHLPYPKIEFLLYACDWRGLVAHGSPLGDLATIEPIRKSTDTSEFGSRQQIFASPDAIWAAWFAILDKKKYRSTCNSCIRSGSGVGRQKAYFFQLPAAQKHEPPFGEGTVYLCRAEDFPHRHHIPPLAFFNAELEEWGSTNPVIPLAKIAIQPADFPYLDRVQFRL